PILPRGSSRAAAGIVSTGRRRTPIHSVDRGSHRVSEGGLEPRRGVRRPADSSVDLRERYLQLRPITPSFGALCVQNVSTELRSGGDSTGHVQPLTSPASNGSSPRTWSRNGETQRGEERAEGRDPRRPPPGS